MKRDLLLAGKILVVVIGSIFLAISTEVLVSRSLPTDGTFGHALAAKMGKPAAAVPGSLSLDFTWCPTDTIFALIIDSVIYASVIVGYLWCLGYARSNESRNSQQKRATISGH